MDPDAALEEGRYRCPRCGSLEVQLCFPVWVKANDLDNQELWELDIEASPEKDSDKGYCPCCSEHVLVARAREARDGT